MEFVYTSAQTTLEEYFGGFFCVNAFGKIEAGDSDKFKKFLETSQVPPRTNIYIDSIGGDVEEAIKIGRTIRSSWFGTDVGQYVLDHTLDSPHITPRKKLLGRCLSAATLVYLGGRLRYLDSNARFGVHQFSFTNPSPRDFSHSQKLSAKIANYIADMSIDLGFIELSASVESDQIKILSKEELERIGVVTGGVTKPVWAVEAIGGGIYARGERDSLFGHHKVILFYGSVTEFGFVSVIEALGRERELLSFSLVEIIVNDEDIRIDISDRCERTINGIYVNISAPLTEDEARLLAQSQSFGIQIRASSEAELFLGISAMNTTGGEEALNSVLTLGISNIRNKPITR